MSTNPNSWVSDCSSPVTITQLVQLEDLKIPVDNVNTQRVRMVSDRWITVRHSGHARSKKVVEPSRCFATIVNPSDSEPHHSWYTIADSVIMNPNLPVICLKSGLRFQIFTTQHRRLLCKLKITSKVLYWTWLTESVVGIVCPDAVYHWHIDFSDVTFSGTSSRSPRQSSSAAHNRPSSASSSLSSPAASHSRGGDQRVPLNGEPALSPRSTTGRGVGGYSAASRKLAGDTSFVSASSEDVTRIASPSSRAGAASVPSSSYYESPPPSGAHADSKKPKFKGVVPNSVETVFSPHRRITKSGQVVAYTSDPELNWFALSALSSANGLSVSGTTQLVCAATGLTQCIDAHAVRLCDFRFDSNPLPSTTLCVAVRDSPSTMKVHVLELTPIRPGNLAPSSRSEVIDLPPNARCSCLSIASLLDQSALGTSPPRLAPVQSSLESLSSSDQLSASLRSDTAGELCSPVAEEPTITGGQSRSMGSLDGAVSAAAAAGSEENAEVRAAGRSRFFVNESSALSPSGPCPPTFPPSSSSDVITSSTSQEPLLRSQRLRVSCTACDRYDFPVSLQVSRKLGLLYVTTKHGELFVMDMNVATLLFTCRVSTSVLFTTTLNTRTQGLLGINRDGQVLSIEIKAKALARLLRAANRDNPAQRLEHNISGLEQRS